MLKQSCNLLLIFIMMLLGCDQTPDYKLFPKIDSHVHIRADDSAFVQQAKADNFQVLTITTRASSTTYIDEQKRFMRFQLDHFPETVAWATTFSMENWGEPDWQQNVIAGLKEDFAAGAIAVKVWKDIGMTFRRPDSSFIMIDDPSFDAILDFIAQQGKTLVAHIGEPKNCLSGLSHGVQNMESPHFVNSTESRADRRVLKRRQPTPLAS